MLQFLLCLFGLHGAAEIDYTVDDEEIKVCRDCLYWLLNTFPDYKKKKRESIFC